MAAVTLRPATEADRDAVNRLLAECGLMQLDSGAQFGPLYVVAGDGATLFGVAGVEVYAGDAALLRSVAVSPAARSTGAGTALVEDRLAWCRAHGIGRVYLLTTTAAAYFARFGFQEVARESAPPEVARSYQWASACPSSSTAMRLEEFAMDRAARLR